MKQIKVILIIGVELLFTVCAFGQGLSEGALSKMKHFHIFSPENLGKNHAGIFMLDKSDTLDMSQLHVIYEVIALRDTLHDRRETDNAILQIGSKWMKFYGQTQWRLNYNHTLSASGKEQINYNDLSDLVVDFTIYRNINTDTLVNQHTMPFWDSRTIIYREHTPLFDWDITTETKMIADYLCQHATAYFGGRVWSVWFTTKIPVNCGLWKFNGLPGLILEAEDSQKYYQFRVCRIIQSREPILFYEIPAENMTRTKWRKLEKQAYSMPVEFYGRDEGFILRDSKTGAMKQLDSSWTIPYNPIERE